MMIDPTDWPDWDSFVVQFPNHTVFHSSAWARVLQKSYNYTACYFAVSDNTSLSAALPLMEIRSPFTGKRGVSLPFTDSVSSLTRNAGNAEHLFQEAVQHGQKAGWKYIELRDAGKFAADQKLFGRYCTHDLDLIPGEQKLYNNLRNSTRRNIKTAQKQGVRIHISRSADCLKEFCRLNCITRKKHGVPPQPDKFFQKVHEHLLLKNQGFVALAMYRQKPIAGAVYLHFGKSALFKYGASHPDYLFLRPNNLVMWEAIRWYAGRGFRTMNFGRTDPENKGLLQFKHGWNPVESQLGYVRYNLNTRTFETSEKGSTHAWKIFSKMPVPFLKLLGRVLYKHVG
jgi:lipid II:glycine glycyltransferase (peptidoglycan interpeptide bridge formation enzyme)